MKLIIRFCSVVLLLFWLPMGVQAEDDAVPSISPLRKISADHLIENLRILSDGRWLAYNTLGFVTVFNPDGTIHATIDPFDHPRGEEGITNPPSSLLGALELPTGEILFWYGLYTGMLRWWNMETGEMRDIRVHGDEVRGVLLLSDGHILSWGEEAIFKWSITGDTMQIFGVQDNLISTVIQLHGGRVVSADWGGVIRLWEADGTPVRRLIHHTWSVFGLLEVADDHFISWSWGSSNNINLWTSDGEQLSTFVGHRDDVFGMRLLDDGRLLSWSRDRTLRTWSNTGEPLAVLAGHTRPPNYAVELDNGNIMSIAAHREVHLWSADGALLTIMEQCHEERVVFLYPLTNGRAISFGYDRFLCLWGDDGALLALLKGQEQVLYNAHQLEDGRILIWGEISNHVYIWDIDE